MQSERVSIKDGKKPILLVAPHGYDGDDENTGIIARHIAKTINCYYVINNGFERSDQVDVFKDKADCNNVLHCQEDVVKDEFLDPILRFKNKILGSVLWTSNGMQLENEDMYIFYIHGMSDRHRQLSGNDKLDMVVGFGAGSPNSFSCDVWRKDFFIHLLTESGLTVYEGKKGGNMSGWSRNNMNQYFRKWQPASSVHSMQIEIVHDIRSEEDLAILTAEYLATAMNDLLSLKAFKIDKNWSGY